MLGSRYQALQRLAKEHPGAHVFVEVHQLRRSGPASRDNPGFSLNQLFELINKVCTCVLNEQGDVFCGPGCKWATVVTSIQSLAELRGFVLEI